MVPTRKWRSGSASPCQGEGRGFESRLPLQRIPRSEAIFSGSLVGGEERQVRVRSARECNPQKNRTEPWHSLGGVPTEV